MNGPREGGAEGKEHSFGFHPSLSLLSRSLEQLACRHSFHSSRRFSSRRTHYFASFSSLHFCSTPLKLFSHTTVDRAERKKDRNGGSREQSSSIVSVAWRDVAEPPSSPSCNRIIEIRVTVQVHGNHRLKIFKFACGERAVWWFSNVLEMVEVSSIGSTTHGVYVFEQLHRDEWSDGVNCFDVI